MSIYWIIFDNVVSWLLMLWGIALPIYFLLWAIGLTGFRRVTRFEVYNTFYYKLNPVTKIVLGLVVTVIAAATSWIIGAVLTALILISFLTLKDGKDKFLLGLYITIMTIVGVVWTYAPYTPTDVLETAGFHTFTVIWVWPSYFSFMGYLPDLTLQAMIYGFQVAMRFTATTLAALILIMTTTPSGILRALRKVGVPEEIIFALVVAMRTVPRIFDAIEISVNSQFIRGLGANAPKFLRPFYLIYAAVLSTVPVFVYLLRGAKNTAISADTRAFRAFKQRTYLTPMTFSNLDYITFGIMILGLVLMFVAIWLGFGRPIPYTGF